MVRRVDPARLPSGVDVVDYGIRGVHLAYELLDGRYDTLVLVDALPIDERPGTVAVLDASGHTAAVGQGTLDAHSMSPDVVLATLHRLGGHIDRMFVVGCRPEVIEERMELSDTVAGAVDEAVERLVALVHRIEPQQERRPEWTPSSC